MWCGKPKLLLGKKNKVRGACGASGTARGRADWVQAQPYRSCPLTRDDRAAVIGRRRRPHSCWRRLPGLICHRKGRGGGTTLHRSRTACAGGRPSVRPDSRRHHRARNGSGHATAPPPRSAAPRPLRHAGVWRCGWVEEELVIASSSSAHGKCAFVPVPPLSLARPRVRTRATGEHRTRAAKDWEGAGSHAGWSGSLPPAIAGITVVHNPVSRHLPVCGEWGVTSPLGATEPHIHARARARARERRARACAVRTEGRRGGVQSALWEGAGKGAFKMHISGVLLQEEKAMPGHPRSGLTGEGGVLPTLLPLRKVKQICRTGFRRANLQGSAV
eukprot:gene23658-biopygen2849